MEPTNDLFLRQYLRDTLGEFVLIGESGVTHTLLLKECLDLLAFKFRTEEAALLDVAAPNAPRFVAKLVPREERSAEGSAGVSGGRLNPDILEGAFTQQLAVGHTIQRDAAGENQILHAGLLVNVTSDAENNVFGD